VPPRNPNLRLQDIADAIDRIFDYTVSHSLESFAADQMAVDAEAEPTGKDWASAPGQARHA
jgi:uncharacterized protein with HEPN domain